MKPTVTELENILTQEKDLPIETLPNGEIRTKTTEQYMTTLWENIKGRVKFLKENDLMFGDGAEWAMAITEEMERLHTRIDQLEQKLNA